MVVERIVEGSEDAMHHWPFGALIAFVTGLVVAFVLIFASMRSRKKTDA
jgi:predicted permease